MATTAKACIGEKISTKHTLSEKLRAIAQNHSQHKTSNGTTYDVTSAINENGNRLAMITIYTKKGEVIINPLSYYAKTMVEQQAAIEEFSQTEIKALVAKSAAGDLECFRHPHLAVPWIEGESGQANDFLCISYL